MTDQILYDLCLKYGRQALLWRQKFIGLLPEVNRRRLFEKKGFGSIFEFAKKLAGLSEEQVRRVLNLERRFESLPQLKNALVEGEVSIHKLARVVSIATPENEEALVEQVKLLSQPALETLVRDFKAGESKSVRPHTLELSSEVTQRLAVLQEKGLDINELLMEFLEKRERDIEDEKATLATECEQTSSRYIPVAVRRVIEKQFGEKCSMPTCPRPSENLHHTQRFALAQRHDPRYLAPLCKNHHSIAHSIDLRVQEKRAKALRC